MSMVSDLILLAAALGATFYCFVLSRRLSRFNDLEKGVGGAIAVLSAQVDEMTTTLQAAQGAATASTSSLGDLTSRAEDTARRLELLVASMHDLPGLGTGRAPSPPSFREAAAQPAPSPGPRPAPPPPAPAGGAESPMAYEPVPITGLFSSTRAAPGAA